MHHFVGDIGPLLRGRTSPNCTARFARNTREKQKHNDNGRANLFALVHSIGRFYIIIIFFSHFCVHHHACCCWSGVRSTRWLFVADDGCSVLQQPALAFEYYYLINAINCPRPDFWFLHEKLLINNGRRWQKWVYLFLYAKWEVCTGIYIDKLWYCVRWLANAVANIHYWTVGWCWTWVRMKNWNIMRELTEILCVCFFFVLLFFNLFSALIIFLWAVGWVFVVKKLIKSLNLLYYFTDNLLNIKFDKLLGFLNTPFFGYTNLIIL